LNLVKQEYFNTIKSGTTLSDLKQGYDTILTRFGHAIVSLDIDSLFNFNLANTPADFQYHYDLLKDLIDTYNEIKELLLHINVHCCPNIGSFPKHLMLGEPQVISNNVVVEPNDTVNRQFRHRFYKSPIIGHEDQNYNKVINLLHRVAAQVNNYVKGEKGELEYGEIEIRITPSLLNGQLGEKAIPYYYNLILTNDLLKFWSFDKTVNFKEECNLSYHIEQLSNEPSIQQPLLYSMDQNDFYRIEGHLGLNDLTSKDEINLQKKDHGLDFDCIVINLVPTADEKSFTTFVSENPAIKHNAGVAKGGTFILLSNNGEVVADFSLLYKIAPPQIVGGEEGCCPLVECTYPWISTLKYLNNLSRSLKGTQSEFNPMPQDYRLQIIEYKINGTRLIGKTVTISIPLEEIYWRRMHAITDALNHRFDKGVVFDYNEVQKRFIITRAKEDNYTIRFRDVTQAINNPIYTYSNTGMYRNDGRGDKVFRYDSIICRDIKTYNPSFYEKLQDKIAPVNKDDDYGSHNKKWEKWYSLREELFTFEPILKAGLTRMITKSSLLPPEIATIIPDMKADFKNATRLKTSKTKAYATEFTLSFWLDGDWVNGDWVNSFMLKHYVGNSDNTHDPIVLFMNLREFLKKESGVTKLSIYITNRHSRTHPVWS